MQDSDVRPQMRIKTNHQLGSTNGFTIAKKHIDARRPNAEGMVHSYVPGHGGDVWFVTHDDGSVGAYCFNEFEPIKSN